MADVNERDVNVVVKEGLQGVSKTMQDDYRTYRKIYSALHQVFD